MFLYMSAERNPERRERDASGGKTGPRPPSASAHRQPQIQPGTAEKQQAPHRELVVERPGADERGGFAVPECRRVDVPQEQPRAVSNLLDAKPLLAFED